MAYSFKVLFDERKRLPYRLQRKSENVNAMIQTRLNVGIVNEELNQYDDLLKLFLDTPYQYHSKVEDSQQTGCNWFQEVDENIFTFKQPK